MLYWLKCQCAITGNRPYTYSDKMRYGIIIAVITSRGCIIEAVFFSFFLVKNNFHEFDLLRKNVNAYKKNCV